MPQNRTGYSLRFQDIAPENPALGRVALVPWDSDLFGFPVAQFQPEAKQLDITQAEEVVLALPAWLKSNSICLCSCVISADDRLWKSLLPRMGFRFVDLALRVALNNLQSADLPPARTALREAVPEDHDSIQEIAGQAFRHGRFHADPAFPRELADLRYRRWMANALAGTDPIQRVYVMGEPGRVTGFYHFTVEEATSDLRLAAVAPEMQRTGLGFDLYLGLLHVLKSLGIRRVVSSISSANTAVMNLYSMLGFHFLQPEAAYHWHAGTWTADGATG